jgi:hypothetical protein
VSLMYLTQLEDLISRKRGKRGGLLVLRVGIVRMGKGGIGMRGRRMGKGKGGMRLCIGI